MIRIVLLIRSLEIGGAERQLIELAKGLDKRRFAVTLLTFYDGGGLRPELEGCADVRLGSLHKARRWDVLPFLSRLQRTVRELDPHIIYGCMSIANELSLLVGRASRAKVVWAVQSSNMDWGGYSWADAAIFRLSALLSRFPDAIIVNSHVGKRHYVAHSHADRRMVVIHTGFDYARFHPNDAAGRRVREEWGVAPHERLIGVVARLDPMKDHPTFLGAAAMLARQCPHIRFVCVGDGPAPYRQTLVDLADSLGLGQRVIWAGARGDMPAVYNALDLITSSSAYGEGFSNVLGEAMACGIPCVVTDVGDSAILARDRARIVPPRDPEALVEAWGALLDLSPEQWRAAKETARDRIVREHSVQRFVRETEAILTNLAGGG